jgi:hypothetical protein
MSKPQAPRAVVPASLTLPLTPEQRAAYEDLYSKYEVAIEENTDPGVLEALNASQLAVESVLSQDAQDGLKTNTALYGALLTQIKTTNDGLKTLKAQIQAISSGVSTFSDILAAITKVLSLIPGA